MRQGKANLSENQLHWSNMKEKSERVQGFIKHMRKSKTQNCNKAWVLAVIQLKSSKIVHLLFKPTELTQQSSIADHNLLVLLYAQTRDCFS